MLRTEKEQLVAELAERLRSAGTLIIADYRGLSHAELDDVRGELLKHGARLAVVKNSLTKRAADAAGVDLNEFLTGPTAIAFVHDGDMVAVAKTLNETAKTTRRLELKGGVLDGKPIDAGAVRDLATLPPLELLRGQVLGAIVAPLTSLAGLVSAPLQNLVGLIDSRIAQLEASSGAPAAPTEEPENASVGETGDDGADEGASPVAEPPADGVEDGASAEADQPTTDVQEDASQAAEPPTNGEE